MAGFSGRCPSLSGSGPRTGLGVDDAGPGQAVAHPWCFVASAVSRLPFGIGERQLRARVRSFGCGRSARAMTHIPVGQSDRSISPVSSVTHAPSRGARRRRRPVATPIEGSSPVLRPRRGSTRTRPSTADVARSAMPRSHRSARAVGGNQHLATRPLARGGGGPLLQCGFGDLDVIYRGVRPCAT